MTTHNRKPLHNGFAIDAGSKWALQDHVDDSIDTDASAGSPAPPAQVFGPVGSSSVSGNYMPTDTAARDSWHINDISGRGNDIRVQAVWPEYTGRGIHVGVYDDGIQASHPDLSANYDSFREFVYNGVVQDPTQVINTGTQGAQGNDKPHGTSVAGVIAAAADNGIGTVGVAYNAKVTGVVAYSTVQSEQSKFTLDYDQKMMALAAQNFDVVNMSYAQSDPLNFVALATPPIHYGPGYVPSYYGDAVWSGMETSAEQGRQGLGTVFVASASNSRVAWAQDTNGDGSANDLPLTDKAGKPVLDAAGNKQYDTWHNAGDANLMGPQQSSRYTIDVAALDIFGYVASYSSPGANILVTAPTEIPSTDLTGDDGWTKKGPPSQSAWYSTGDYVSNFDGTSAAAPVVSGVVALMLEANPHLGWRDVKEILSLSARHVGSDFGGPLLTNEFHSWFFNGATDWNGGGRHFSEDYGFGEVDAHAAVRLAETWTQQSTSANEMHSRPAVTSAFNGTLHDGLSVTSPSIASDTFSCTDQIKVETITVNLKLTHSQIADLHIWLTSPNGTSVDLLRPGTGAAYLGPNSGIYMTAATALTGGNPTSWQFTSTAFAGESGAGTWTVNVLDGDHNSLTGTFTGATLDLYGSAATADNLYVYTDEFASLPINGTHDFTIFDVNGGVDTINAAAVTSDTVIDLSTGNFQIAGREGTVGGAGSASDPTFYMIENVVTGDGEDTIIGNSANNWLSGGRGDDILHGGEGNDRLEGGLGVDNLYGDAGDDILVATYEKNFGVEIMDGGAGNDTADFSSFDKAVAIDLTATGHEVRTRDDADLSSGTWRDIARLYSIENLVGGAGSDHITGDAQANKIDGGAGSDWLDGGAGNDVLSGGTGNDTFHFGDHWGNDVITDFEIGKDLVDLKDVTGLHLFSQLAGHITDDPAHDLGHGAATITFGNDSITLIGLKASDVTDSMFAFTSVQTTNTTTGQSVQTWDSHNKEIWTDEIVTFDSQGRQTGETVHYDSGARAEVGLDPANLYDWSDYVMNYDNKGRITSEVFNYDDHTRKDLAWDPDNKYLWKDYTITSDSQGRWVSEVQHNDDGGRTDTAWDVDNKYTWKDQAITVDLQGRWVSETQHNDNGTTTLFGWDAANQYTWKDYTTNQDVNGHNISKTIHNDDGTSTATVWDAASQNTWSDYTITYDTLGRQTTKIAHYDNGTSTATVWDAASQNTWSDYTITYDTSGRQTTKIAHYDNGTSTATVWDAASQNTWSDYTITYDTSGRQTTKIAHYDNGTSTATVWDAASQNTWSDYTITYDTMGRQTTKIAHYDNGTSTATVWDAGSQNTWSDYTISYDTLGRQTTKIAHYDDGTSTATVWDAGSQNTWSDYTISYDTLGRQTTKIAHYDDGTSTATVWDAASQNTWSDYTTSYDALGRTTSKTVDYDNGTHAISKWDVANTANWSSMVTNYDANWHQTSQSGIYDNGTTWHI